jgi:hypothetical protein
MTSATLYREGDDLDSLLAELDAEHPGQVRVVEVSYPRTGGVAGFFAKQRVAVQYALQPAEFPVAQAAPKHDSGASAPGRPRPRPTPRPAAAPTWVETREPRFVEPRDLVDNGALSGLLAQADSRDNLRRGDEGTSNADFAQLLLELAAKKSANRVARNLDAQVRAASKVSGLAIRPAARVERPAEPAVVEPVAVESAFVAPSPEIVTEVAAAPLAIGVPASASPVIDSLIADALAEARDAEAPAATSFEPIVAPVVASVSPAAPAVARDASRAGRVQVIAIESTLDDLFGEDDVDEAAAFEDEFAYGPEMYEPERYEPEMYEPEMYEPEMYEPERYEPAVVEPHPVSLRWRKPANLRSASVKSPTRLTTARRNSASSFVEQAIVETSAVSTDDYAPATTVVPKISIPDLSLRSLTSATAAVVADDTISPTQKDLMKDLRDKLADVVMLLDKLADSGDSGTAE